MGTVRDMRLAQGQRQQRFHLQTDKCPFFIAEQALCMRIGQHDDAMPIDHDHRIRCCLEQRTKQVGIGSLLAEHVSPYIRRTVDENR
ncbi:hypothetical protein HFP05_01175 [Rhodanobacter denitrificans]|nr:hypothetical protein [Rhodanobacter denitrificans]